MNDLATLEELAMFVECPVCGACDWGGDSVEACWNAQGTEREETHPERLERAREELMRARQALAALEPA